jgi:hypothetical protein
MTDVGQEVSAAAHSLPQVRRFIDQTWPAAIVGIGFCVTVAWICLLGYAIGNLVRLPSVTRTISF